MQCPVDSADMQVHASGELDVESCPSCAGVWVHHSRLTAFKALGELIAGPPDLRGQLARREGISARDAEPGPCPACGEGLASRSVAEGMDVAACMACGGAWIASESLGPLLWEGPDPGILLGDKTSETDSGRFDRFSFNHPLVFVLALPAASLAAVIVNSSFLAGLMRPFHIWIHEFGHATIAWLSGRRALPLPIGWTSWQPERSTVVYFALLFLLGVLFYSALREKLRGAMVFALAAALVQFVITWTFPQQRVELWITFGGIGSEFYLSALLMILFYFPMPDRFRWDFWRYPLLLVATSTFWESFSFWNRVERGRESIPWGSILGAGDAGGDMDRLVFQHNWANDRIIGAYNGLGDLCLLFLVGVYLGFCVVQRKRIAGDLRRRIG